MRERERERVRWRGKVDNRERKKGREIEGERLR